MNTLKKMNATTLGSILFFFCISTCLSLKGQDVGGKTLISQSRTTTANIGKAEITIKYHSPSVNNRKIFGGIVPYDFVVDGKEYPWRAGSNQRTTIEFSHDVKINGKDMPAGIYGFVILVSDKEWTLIFSNGKSWGAFNYDRENDVLREKVKPRKSPFQEWLSYDFMNPKHESVDIELRWEETAVSFNVSTDAVANTLQDLSEKETKSINDYQQLAIWTLEQDPSKTDEALLFLEKAIEMIPNEEHEVMKRVYKFSSHMIKAGILLNIGEVEKGEKLKQEMFSIADGFDMYYYALRKYSVEGKKAEALSLLKDAVQRNPDNYQNHFALGEYYLLERNQAKATEHFKIAYDMTVDQNSNWLNYAQYLYHQNRLALQATAND